MISLDIQYILRARHCAAAGDRWRADTGLFSWLRTCEGKEQISKHYKAMGSTKKLVGW